MEFSDQSRVWIYQSNRAFTAEEQHQIVKDLNAFAAGWEAHGAQLKAKGELRYGRFLILLVDEVQATASGCSIDRSAGFIRDIEKQYGVNMFDRFNMAYKKDGEVYSCTREEFEALVQAGEINADTVVFNNMVQTKGELDAKWEVSFKESWHARVFA
ncbi:MAG: ABC transporter ATPase [Arcticibacter sp.]